ncbi:MAG TPA: tetraacyldisaccharide 4'-kinase [Caulobacterales bacterium]|nr:tetraacyldisaccharide 4'-kinase [Caulobacterales bacterium]
MRPPEFWSGDAVGRDSVPILRLALAPVSWLYGWAAAERIRTTQPRHASVPVVCVGNLTVGGAGKTPVARTVRARLGKGAHLLSRGYGGKLAGPLRVTPDMSATEVGDEPLLHAADGPAWIARDRFAGAQAAAIAGAHAIVMDDGFQNPELAKDLSIVVVDAEAGVGNGAVFPAGPLRERLENGLSRADAIVLLSNSGDEPELFGWLAGFNGPILKAQIAPLTAAPEGKLVAFAGIARPEKFFDTLAALGAEVEEAVPYPDHYAFTDSDFDWLLQMSQERKAKLITTEKDAARLPPAWRARVLTLPVAARFEDEGVLDALLAPIAARMGAAA